MKIQTTTCGIENTMKIIGSKWTMLILYNLCSGTKRFGELQRLLTGISPKTLAERLKQLEENGILTKKIYPQVPLKVEYSLTEKGVSLKRIISQLDQWGENAQKIIPLPNQDALQHRPN